MKKLTTLCILLLICAPLSAQIYSYVDANGNTIYTDNPPKGQETRLVDIPNKPSSITNKAESPANNTVTANDSNESIRTIKLSPTGRSSLSIPEDNTSNHPDTTKKPLAISYNSLQILIPTPAATIANTGGQMMIQVKSQPALMVGHKYLFLVDDKVVGETLNNVERGEHKVKVQVVNNEGSVLIESAEQLFYIRQTTLADKRRTNPCKLADYGVRPECPLKDKPPTESLLRKVAKVVKETLKNAAATAAEGAIISTLP